METATADEIRAFVNETIIAPARKAGRWQVEVRAGDVHRDMGLKQRVPAVCSALDAQKFQERFRVTLIRRYGPGQGTRAGWRFAIER